ncbi:MAG: DMT family transporter, partial [Candidatus Saccharimonadales bacterium]
IFTSWQVYMLIAFGVFSLYLYQYALATDKLMYAQPGVTLADPFVAIIWGLAVFNETTRGGLYILFALVGVALTALGVFILSRSSALKYLND